MLLSAALHLFDQGRLQFARQHDDPILVALAAYYTEPYSEPLRRFLAEQIGVPARLIHINAGSELILRQLFDRLGEQVHLLTPTYALFPEVAKRCTETPLTPENDFSFDLARLEVPAGTTLVAIVNPNNPNGGTFDMAPLPDLLRRYPATRFLVDEAFIGLGGQSVAHLVPKYPNLLVTRTLSKAHSLAGFRVGYAVLPEDLADDLNTHNDAYPLARPSQAAALATLRHEEKIRERARRLRQWTKQLAAGLQALGVRTFPTSTYFFLADCSPVNASDLANRLRERQILIKPLQDPRLGPGYLRVTTALPECSSMRRKLTFSRQRKSGGILSSAIRAHRGAGGRAVVRTQPTGPPPGGTGTSEPPAARSSAASRRK